jgi:hypothetical protein
MPAGSEATEPKFCDPIGNRTAPGRVDQNRGTTRTCIEVRGVPGGSGVLRPFRADPRALLVYPLLPARRGNHVTTELAGSRIRLSAG